MADAAAVPRARHSYAVHVSSVYFGNMIASYSQSGISICNFDTLDPIEHMYELQGKNMCVLSSLRRRRRHTQKKPYQFQDCI